MGVPASFVAAYQHAISCKVVAERWLCRLLLLLLLPYTSHHLHR
jgi:hypothetical protein